VREIGHVDAPDDLDALHELVTQMSDQRSEQEFSEHLAAAEVVVTGEVTGLCSVAGEDEILWSEHDPDWGVANTPVDNATYVYDSYIGDYADLQALGHDFYGIFSAHNLPDVANFPHGVNYQRNANFVTKQLLNVNGITPVANSIDPFFAHIWWEEEEEEEEREFGYERLTIQGLRYESIEIRKLVLDLADGPHGWDNDEGEGNRHEADHRHHIHARHRRAFRRLADRLEDLADRLADEDQDADGR
jgi:hypothetical protein